jgi:hypothetical protein
LIIPTGSFDVVERGLLRCTFAFAVVPKGLTGSAVESPSVIDAGFAPACFRSSFRLQKIKCERVQDPLHNIKSKSSGASPALQQQNDGVTSGTQ